MEDTSRGVRVHIGNPIPVPIRLTHGSGAGQITTGPTPAGIDYAAHIDGAGEHRLICGENAHTATCLQADGELFDLIYLDPPYDTGSDLSYADERDDWADFFHARMVAAKRLLRHPSGVVIIAIDDRRLNWARLIADSVMGAKQLAACVVWDGGVHGQASLVSAAHDYMLIYTASASWAKDHRIKWREPRAGVPEAIEAAARCWDGDPDNSRQAMIDWYRSLPADHPATRLTEYTHFEPGTGRLMRPGPVSKPCGGGYIYDVIHPATGRPVPPPSSGWRYAPARMQQMLAQDRILFRDDPAKGIATKLYLDEQATSVPHAVFTEARTRAAKRLAAQVGPGKFTYPKDTGVLQRWFTLVTQSNPHARVLDLFAGSGATTEAVMRMNAADGGRRASVSVTNNELGPSQATALLARGVEPGTGEWEAQGVFEQVARPRLEMVARETKQQLQIGYLQLGAGEVLIDSDGLAHSPTMPAAA